MPVTFHLFYSMLVKPKAGTRAGFDMLEAWDGEAALASAASERPDLILMDIQLPGLNGYEVTRRLKTDPVLRKIPIIAITSYALSGDEGKAHAAGCEDTLPSPTVRVSCWRKSGNKSSRAVS